MTKGIETVLRLGDVLAASQPNYAALIGVVALVFAFISMIISVVVVFLRRVNKNYEELARAYGGRYYRGIEPEVHFDHAGNVVVDVFGCQHKHLTIQGNKGARWLCSVPKLKARCQVWGHASELWGERGVDIGSAKFARRFWIRGEDAARLVTPAVEEKIEALRLAAGGNGSMGSSNGCCAIHVYPGTLSVTVSNAHRSDGKRLREITELVLQLRDEIRRIEG